MVFISIYDTSVQHYVFQRELHGSLACLSTRGDENTDFCFLFPNGRFIDHDEFYELAEEDLAFFEERHEDYAHDPCYLALQDCLHTILTTFADESRFRISLLN